MKPVCRALKAAALILFVAGAAGSDLNAQSVSNRPDDLFLQLSYGHSFTSVRLLGKTTGTVSNITDISISKYLKTLSGGTHIYYRASLIPYIRYHYPRRDYDESMAYVRGIGFSPLGFSFQKALTPRFTLWAETAGGLALVGHNFPTDKGRKLNFTFELSPALIFKLNKPLALAAGYKFHHISNANTGRQNPGIDSNFLFLSLIFF